MASAAHAETATRTAGTGHLGAPVTAAVLSGLAAAWLAAGSTGLLAHSLRHTLVLLALALAWLVGWPTRRTAGTLAAVLAGAALALLLGASALKPVNVLGVALALAGLAIGHTGANRAALGRASVAVAAFGFWRIGVLGLAPCWLAADALAGWLGHAAAWTVGRELDVGPSFAGLDLLVFMGVFLAAWLPLTPAPRCKRALWSVAAVLAGQWLYLALLAWAPQITAALPALPADPAAQTGWTPLLQSMVPWDLPIVGAAIQLLIAGAVLRWTHLPPAPPAQPRRRGAWLWAAAGLAAAAALPLLTTLYPQPYPLAGRKIVVYEKGFLNWLKPTFDDYGRLSMGMYGLLPDYAQAAGATMVRSPNLSAEDLSGAAALIIIYPNEPWAPGQLERVWEFVRQGGSLLIMGEHTIREADGQARFNDLLAPTAMHVPFDTAEWAVGGWLDCYECLAHPLTAGRRGDRNSLGVVIGASVNARWPARPLILGQWGFADWGDPGSPRAMLGDGKYKSGERLGDVCLAAEQRLGQGKIVLFGDTSSLANGVAINCHAFNGSLLGYLCAPTAARSWWREALGLLAAAVLAAAILRAHAGTVAAMAATAAVALLLCTAVTYRAHIVYPAGKAQAPLPLAYIDGSHLEGPSGEAIREDGLMGLQLNLARNGILPLTLTDFDPQALQRAAIFFSVAPARRFTGPQRAALRDFVARGGVFICTAGYDHATAANEVLADYGLWVGNPAGPNLEPSPLGFFKSPYLIIKDTLCYVRFWSAWPVGWEPRNMPDGTPSPPAIPIAFGRGNVPAILMRPYGQGKVVVVGDSAFLTNLNLENMDGSPTEGLRENTDFWHWFLPYLTHRPPWLPSPPAPTLTPGQGGQPPATTPAPATPATTQAATREARP